MYFLEGLLDVVTLLTMGVISGCEMLIEDPMVVVLEKFKVPNLFLTQFFCSHDYLQYHYNQS